MKIPYIAPDAWYRLEGSGAPNAGKFGNITTTASYGVPGNYRGPMLSLFSGGFSSAHFTVPTMDTSRGTLFMGVHPSWGLVADLLPGGFGGIAFFFLLIPVAAPPTSSVSLIELGPQSMTYLVDANGDAVPEASNAQDMSGLTPGFRYAHTVAVAWDGTNPDSLKMYVDGEVIQTASPLATSPTSASNVDIYVGTSLNSPCPEYISNLMYWRHPIYDAMFHRNIARDWLNGVGHD